MSKVEFHGSRPDIVVSGLEAHDDGAVVAIARDNWLVQSVDFISPASDNPYHFGQIAAANALSDVYAMGGKPTVALNICCFPPGEHFFQEIAQVLQGAADVMRGANAQIVGGHTVASPVPFFGLSVTGSVSPTKVRRQSGLRVGDALVLTKPLGTGVYLSAYRQHLISVADFQIAETSMRLTNGAASAVAEAFDVGGCTDVTGFGMAGHAIRMARASNVGVRLYLSKVPSFPRVSELLAMGVVTRNTDEIVIYASEYLQREVQSLETFAHILFDPQTSGGLLMSVTAKMASKLVDGLHTAGLASASIVGEVVSSGDPFLEVV